MFVLYIYDGISMSHCRTLIEKAIKDVIAVGLKIEDQGYPSDYVGINIKQNNDGSIKVSASINSIHHQ